MGIPFQRGFQHDMRNASISIKVMKTFWTMGPIFHMEICFINNRFYYSYIFTFSILAIHGFILWRIPIYDINWPICKKTYKRRKKLLLKNFLKRRQGMRIERDNIVIRSASIKMQFN